MMNETWEFAEPETGNKRTLRVGDLFEENQLLMNLERQPENIRALIKETVEHEIRNHGTFSLFHFQKFCAKFGLKRIADDAQYFVELFSSTGIKSPLKEETKAINAEKKRKSTLVF
jgi:hypothetical protein